MRQAGKEEEEEDREGDRLHHVVGDVTRPVAPGTPAGPPGVRVVVHCANNSGEWSGSGVEDADGCHGL